MGFLNASASQAALAVFCFKGRNAMGSYKIPYGHTHLSFLLEDSLVNGVIACKQELSPGQYGTQDQIVTGAMSRPIGTKTLTELAKGKGSCTILVSDHTRPVPSKFIIPHLLNELRRGSPGIQIKLLVATGCHRKTTLQELTDKLGADIIRKENIIVHDCQREDDLVTLGALPSGAVLRINRHAVQTELLIAEGFIEPHFFAGFSGGRKSVLPGVCSQQTVLGNHCAKFIASPYARTGNLIQNPIHTDMIAAAKMAGLAYILNVLIDENKKVVAAVAGDFDLAHRQGCDLLCKKAKVNAVCSDIVIAGNGGYPLDQNLYQSVKGMTAAQACTKPDGVIIMCAECVDGSGGEAFYQKLKNCGSPGQLLKEVEKIPMDQTAPDQWQYQILASILKRHRVIMVCNPRWQQMVIDMKMHFAPTPEAAVDLARNWKGKNAHFTIIPNGVCVIVE